jgi:uncharacterized protein YqcC (DUF446 family)
MEMNYPTYGDDTAKSASISTSSPLSGISNPIPLTDKINDRNNKTLDAINTVITDLAQQIDFVLLPESEEAKGDEMAYPDENMVSPYERQAMSHHRELQHILDRLQTLTVRVAITRS